MSYDEIDPIDYTDLLELQDHKRDGKSYLLDCPKCGGSKLSCSPTGPFQCWGCGYKGHVSQLKLEFELAPRPKEAIEDIYHGMDYSNPKIDLYLAGRGLTNGIHGLEFGWHLPSDSIAIPYPGKRAYKVKGGPGKTFIKGEYPGHFTPLPIQDEVIIVEGEMDCLASIQLTQIPSVGMCGVTNIKNTIKDIPASVKTIYIWLDNDDAGKAGTSPLAQALRERFPVQTIKLVRYPDDFTGKDPNDLLLSQAVYNINENSEEYLEDKVARPASFYFKGMLEYLGDDVRAQGVPTGLAGLDAQLGGGKRLGEVTALQAMAKTGKNCLWHQLMWYWAEAGIPMGYASRELSPDSEVLPNLLSIHTKNNLWKNLPTDTAGLRELEASVARWPIHFAHGYGVFDIVQIKKWVQELTARGVKYFWIDHFHFCMYDPENPKEISLFARELKTLAKEHNIHIDLIIQPKYVDQDKGLSLQTLRGGAAIGQAIDNLFVLERDLTVTTKNITRLKLVAARHKLCDTSKVVYLQYDQETTRMMEVNIEDQPREIQPEVPGRSWK